MTSLSAREGDILVVDALEDELILEVGIELHGDTGKHLDFLDLLTTEEVLDFDGPAVLGNDDIDGEVSVDESHFVSVAGDNTVDHVADEGLESGNRAALLGATEPHLDVEIETLSILGLLLLDAHLNWHVLEALGDLASGSLHLHLSCLYSHGN